MRFGEALRARFGMNLIGASQAPDKTPQNFTQLVSTTPYYAPPAGDTTSLLALYKTNPWVRTIVAKVGKSVARPKWYLETKDGKRVDKHPALEFLRAGSPRLRGRPAIAVTAMHLDLASESHWAIGRDAKGRPASFAPMPPHWVEGTPTERDPFYTIRPNQRSQVRIRREDVLSFIETDPADPYGRGASLTGSAKVELSTDEAASTFLDSFFKNRARPDILVSGTDKGPLRDEDRARLELTWMERFRGSRRAGKPLFTALPLEIHELGSGLRDNSVADIRDQMKATVAEIYNIPPELLGRLDNSNRATIDGADFLFSSHVVTPRLDTLFDVLDPFLDAEFKLTASGLALRYDSPVKEDVDPFFKAVQVKKSAFTKNELRVAAGKRPMIDPEFDEPMDDDGGSATAIDPEDETDDTPDGGDKKPKPKDDVEDDEERSAKTPEVRSMKPEDVVSVSQAHQDPQVSAEATRILDEILTTLLATYGDELLAQLENEAVFELNMSVANWLKERSSKLLGHIDATTAKALEKALREGADASEGLEALSKRIDDLFRDAAEMRAILIGDTEATALTGFGSLEAARQGGFQKKTWLTSQDHVVRDTHKSLNGQVVPVNEPFRSSSGAVAQHPGAFGRQSEDINCRCAMRPVLPGERTGATRDASKKFQAWHAEAFDVVSSDVASSVRRIFKAQAEVAKAQLRRTFAGRVS